MNSKLLDQLLSQEEGPSLEFKSSIDFGSKAGKAMFIQEMLALANTTNEEPAYLLLGIEDETKRLVDFEDVTEEQLQQIIADNCRPPIVFSYRTVDYQGSEVGVVKIEPSEGKPHTTKTRYGYENPFNHKQKEILDTDVYVRRGSTINLATTEEIIRMAQTQSGQRELTSRIVGHIRHIDEVLDEIEYDIRSGQDYLPKQRPFVECAFVGLLTAGFVRWQWGPNPLPAFPICFFIYVVASAIKIVNYQALDILLYGLFTSLAVFLALILPMPPQIMALFAFGDEMLGQVVIRAFMGMLTGLLAAVWINRAR
jgi:hypothetical protein